MMKQTLKKALSLLMTMAILCSFAVIPANAAGAVTIGLENGSWDGDKYTVDVVASGDDFKVASVEVDVEFDPELMSFVANDTGVYPGYATVSASVQGGNTVHAAGMSLTDVSASGGKLTLVTLTFQMVAGVETPTASLQVVVDDALFEDTTGDAPTLSAGSALSVTLPVQAPPVAAVTLGKTAANVDGSTGDSTTIKAESAKGTDITSAVEWTVSPSGEGVTVSNGTVTVDAKAKAGDYVITAASGGSSKTATLTVTRAASVITSVEIDGSKTIALSNEDGNAYSAVVKDQYGDESTETIAWTLGGGDAAVAKLSATSGETVRVTLTEDAEEEDAFTLTATAGGVSKTIDVKVVQGTVYAKAEKWTGDDGSRVYIAIEDIDHANDIRDLYLDDLLPSRVNVTYLNGETDYSSQYRVKWSATRLWDLFKDLRDHWEKYAGNKGYYVVSNLGYYIESDGTEGTPVEIDYSNWFSLIIDEGSAEANGWYEEENTYVPPAPSANFTDVAAGYWAADDINWCFAKNVMLGNSATTFNPTGVTSRQQLWMVLARVNGSAPDSMATARTWAINMGVSDGTNVSGSLTRQQMVAMLYRYSAIKGYSGKIGGSLSAFSDAGSVSAYARDAMSWAVANGIIAGNDGRLNPNGTATRAQFAAIMHRFCDTFKVI